MAFYHPEPSHTFSEYLLIPNLTRKDCTTEAVSLGTPLVRFKKGGGAHCTAEHSLCLRSGGIAFIFVSQPVKAQVEMVERVKKFKAGFVVSDSNLRPDALLQDVLAWRERSGHTTMAVTTDSTPTGELVGMLAKKGREVEKKTGQIISARAADMIR